MVREFLSSQSSDGTNQPPDEGQVGRLTGLLGGAFNLAQLITSFALGLLSDKVGRKPILVLGNAACFLSICMYGLARKYWHAVAARLFGGILNGIIGAEKAAIGEAFHKEDQSRAFTYFALVWGIGTLTGPLMGGLLSSPCAPGGLLSGTVAISEGEVSSSSPSSLCQAGSLMVMKPFFLPCVVTGCISLIALVVIITSFEETLPGKMRRGGSGLKSKSSDAALSVIEYDRVENGEDYDAAATTTTGNEIEMIETTTTQKQQQQQHYGDQEEASPFVIDDSTIDIHSPPPPPLQANSQWWQIPSVYLSLMGYALICLLFIMIDELTPIFASADIRQGGLGFSTKQLTPSLSISGLSLIIWTLTGFPYLMDYHGAVFTTRIGLWLTIPNALLIPAATLGWGDNNNSGISSVTAQVTMILALFAKSINATNAFTACIVLVNVAAPKQYLGTINGVGQTLASLMRGTGPLIGGWLWAVAVNLASPGHQYIPFAVAAVIALLTDRIYAKLRFFM